MKMSSRVRLSLLALGVSFASLSSGCGGGGGATTCGKVQPCGGNLVGSWKLSSSCSDAASLELGITACPTARVDSVSQKPTGTASFTANGAYSVIGSNDVTLSFTLPADCLAAQGGTATACAAVHAGIQAEVGSTYKSGSCVVKGADCSCTTVFNPQAIDEAGTYTTEGTVVTTTATGDTASSTDYCVQGSSLHMIQVDATMTMGAMGTVKVLGDTVLTKS